jgi:recombination protein RecR
MTADPIARLIQQLAKLPGIGEKTATRLAFHVLRSPATYAQELAAAILEVKERIRLCSLCMNLTETDPCGLCQDSRRDRSLVCVVAQPTDLLAIERAGGFRGCYHVLHGVLAPLDGIGPDDLRVRELVGRASGLREAIIATSPNVEGEATALYLAKLLKPLGVRVTRIASGLPFGGELEYSDGLTITRAMEGRREF